MKPSPTDINPLPQRYRNLVPLTGLTARQMHIACAQPPDVPSPNPGRPGGLPLPASALLVLIHLPTDLTTRAPNS